MGKLTLRSAAMNDLAVFSLAATMLLTRRQIAT